MKWTKCEPLHRAVCCLCLNVVLVGALLICEALKSARHTVIPAQRGKKQRDKVTWMLYVVMCLFASVGLLWNDKPVPNHHLIHSESQTITPSIVRAPKCPNAHGTKAAAAARWHPPAKEKHIAGYKISFFRILGCSVAVAIYRACDTFWSSPRATLASSRLGGSKNHHHAHTVLQSCATKSPLAASY